MGRVEGRTALVTGASRHRPRESRSSWQRRRQGRGQLLEQRGEGAEVADEIGKFGGTCTWRAPTWRSAAEARAMVKEVAERFGHSTCWSTMPASRATRS